MRTLSKQEISIKKIYDTLLGKVNMYNIYFDYEKISFALPRPALIFDNV